MAAIVAPADRTKTFHVGKLDRVVFCDPDQPFCILILEDQRTVVGPFDADSFTHGTLYKFLGRWEDSDTRGPRFRAGSFIVQHPGGKLGTIRYLSKTSEISEADARRLWEAFNSSCIETLRDKPDVAAQHCRLSPEQAAAASRLLKLDIKTAVTKVELHELFAGRGFWGELIDRAVKKWGAQATHIIRKNPFALLPLGAGAGFKRCDKLWTDLHLPAGSLKRQAYVAWQLARTDRVGHTWLDAAQLAAKLVEMIPEADAKGCFRLCLRARMLKKCRDEAGRLWLATYPRGTAEERIADCVHRLTDSPSLWPVNHVPTSQRDGDRLPSAHQVERLVRATLEAIGLFLGGPGTGKTHSLAYLLRAVAELFGRGSILVCAPTGKAAVRATQSLQLAGLDLTARTIHSTLGIGRNGHDGDGWGFVHDRDNPLDVKFVVVDESSMIDADLMADLLDAIPTGANVLFVGDPYQLPPVGHGAPLRDLVAGGVPCGELTEVRRNAGQIVHACARVKNNEDFDAADRIDLDAAPPKNLKLLEPRDETHAAEMIEQVLRSMRLFHPVWQTQVIVARNKGGLLGRRELNERLHPILNPDGFSIRGNPFQIGDKVICLRNSKMHRVEPIGQFGDSAMSQDAGNYQQVVMVDEFTGARQPEEVFVANGEIGRVEAIGPKLMIARFSEGEMLVKVPLGKQRDEDGPETDSDDQGRGCNFDHAWAVTCHKCVHPDTLVETDEGLLPISRISPTGTIAAPDRAAGYRNFVVNPDGPAVRITTRHGYSITVTPDHRVERWDGEGYSCCEARELRPGDFLRLRLGPIVEPSGPAALPPPPRRDVRAFEFPIPAKMTEDMAEFLGLMVADGTVFDGGFRLVKRHPEVSERFAELCRSLFGCKLAAINNGRATGYEVRSSFLADWLASLGGLCPNAKAVPECVLRSPLRFHRRFLRGLFEDGTVNVKEEQCDHIEWLTAYPQMADVVQTMLLRCGIFVTRSTRKTTGSAGNKFEYPVLYLYGQAAARFRDSIGFISRLKQGRLANCRTSNVKYVMPVAPTPAREIRRTLGKSAGDNALARGTISRDIASKMGWTDSLKWFDSPVESIEPVTCPSMCVEVPDGNRFLQNGFPFWNCQGSESPCVIIVGDESASGLTTREWLYTAISRASKLCILVGRRHLFRKMAGRQALTRRKTFLAERLREVTREVAL